MPVDQAVLQQLRENDAELTSLDLSSETLRVEDVQAIADALKSNNALTQLQLPDLSYNDVQKKALGKSLSHNYSLCEVTGLSFPYVKTITDRNTALFDFLPLVAKLHSGTPLDDGVLEAVLNQLEEPIPLALERAEPVVLLKSIQAFNEGKFVEGLQLLHSIRFENTIIETIVAPIYEQAVNVLKQEVEAGRVTKEALSGLFQHPNNFIGLMSVLDDESSKLFALSQEVVVDDVLSKLSHLRQTVVGRIGLFPEVSPLVSGFLTVIEALNPEKSAALYQDLEEKLGDKISLSDAIRHQCTPEVFEQFSQKCLTESRELKDMSGKGDNEDPGVKGGGLKS